MTIHHTQLRKAEKLGFHLEQAGELVKATWPERATVIFGVSGTEAIAQMQAAQEILREHPDYRIRYVPGDERMVNVLDGDRVLAGCPMTVGKAHRALKGDPEWTTQGDEPQPTGDTADTITDTFEADPPKKEEIERLNGVPVDGAVAYKEGVPSGDCPYSSEDEDEYEDFERWNTEWDDAADAAEEEDEGKGGSVVKEHYRAKYAELGHPNHCGDWLAELLNNYCVGDKNTDLDTFERICGKNGVDTSKYRREGNGWQGRLRMTGRNLLAKRVYLNGGKIDVPTLEGKWETKQAPADWMASQRYKMPKKDQQPEQEGNSEAAA